MEFKKINILIFVKNKYHELLLTKEIQSCLSGSNVISVQSKFEAIRVMSTELVRALVVDIKTGVPEELCNVHQIHLSRPEIPIVAVVDDNSEKFLKKILEIGVTEILQKDETFYVVVPKLIKSLITQEAFSHQTTSVDRRMQQSEHLKVTSQTLAHEINNPLMTILGLTELILDNSFQYDIDLIDKIKVIQLSALRIQNSTHRMTHIISPVYQKTPYGMMINPQKSRIYRKSKVKLLKTE